MAALTTEVEVLRSPRACHTLPFAGAARRCQSMARTYRLSTKHGWWVIGKCHVQSKPPVQWSGLLAGEGFVSTRVSVSGDRLCEYACQLCCSSREMQGNCHSGLPENGRISWAEAHHTTGVRTPGENGVTFKNMPSEIGHLCRKTVLWPYYHTLKLPWLYVSDYLFFVTPYIQASVGFL